MMKVMAAIAAVAAVSLSGCGTIANLCSGDPEVPLGGVQKDLEAFNTPCAMHAGTGKGAALIVLLLPTELCLSLVADTLTLPLAIFIKRSGYPRDDGRAAATPAAQEFSPAPPVDSRSEVHTREILNRVKNLSDSDRLFLESLGEPVANGPLRR
jgi:uncharacterized protein YceK